ncbi:hypothetical protein RFI_00907 [Reticulomyxa filosa]|uniref:Uncharacterized protein n=1 Tax=Reticulomyxa filosa TaxID=46433 RepID=X6PDM1_RETFI|nr:hypothetical protein RFI_00907 [Reticulomyxa filosa]|eukprot:ETO36154.1 hypothetical protein RFI_00907 [Reticulomyxa filosa]
MLLFECNVGLSIEYDEDNNTFQFFNNLYAYVCINDIILFFSGWNWISGAFSKSVHKYSIRKNKWTIFPNIFPSPLYDCIAILSEGDNDIHITGGKDDKHKSVSTHMKNKVRVWNPSQLSKNEIKLIIEYWIRISQIKFGWTDDFDKLL